MISDWLYINDFTALPLTLGAIIFLFIFFMNNFSRAWLADQEIS